MAVDQVFKAAFLKLASQPEVEDVAIGI